MRFAWLLSFACACASAPKSPAVATAAAPPNVEPPAPCKISTLRLSASGHTAVRPHATATPAGDELAVVWEEEGDGVRGVKFVTLDAATRKSSAIVDVGEVVGPRSIPQVLALPTGFAVLWTRTEMGKGTLALVELDKAGKPISGIVNAISAPNARLLAAAHDGENYGISWWSWSTDPRKQVVDVVDRNGKATGASVSLTMDPVVDPVVDLRATGGKKEWHTVWEEKSDGVENIFMGLASQAGLQQRRLVGRGSAPSLAGEDTVVYTNLLDGSIWLRHGDDAPKRIAEGQLADASYGFGRSAICYVPGTTADDNADTLHCAQLSEAGDERVGVTVTTANEGIASLEVVQLAGRYAVVYETEETDGSAVYAAQVVCGG